MAVWTLLKVSVWNFDDIHYFMAHCVMQINVNIENRIINLQLFCNRIPVVLTNSCKYYNDDYYKRNHFTLML